MKFDNKNWFDQNNNQISLDSLLTKYKDKSISYKSIYDEGEYQGVQITIKFIEVKTPELAEVKAVCSKYIYYSISTKELNSDLTKYLTKRRRDIILNSII